MGEGVEVWVGVGVDVGLGSAVAVRWISAVGGAAGVPVVSNDATNVSAISSADEVETVSDGSIPESTKERGMVGATRLSRYWLIGSINSMGKDSLSSFRNSSLNWLGGAAPKPSVARDAIAISTINIACPILRRLLRRSAFLVSFFILANF